MINRYINIGLKFLLTLCLLALTQIGMYVFNPTIFAIDGGKDLFLIFIGMVRFGLSSTIVFLLPFLIIAAFPIKLRENKQYQKLSNILYIMGTNLILILNSIDIGYYKFTYKRITYDFFNYLGVGGDFKELIPQFARDYWHIIIVFIVLNILLGIFNKKINRRQHPEFIYNNRRWYMVNIPIYLLFCGLLFLGQRGGVQLRPLSIVHANLYTSSQNTPLVLNTPFTLYRTWGREGVEITEYFKDKNEMKKYFNPIIMPNNNGEKGGVNINVGGGNNGEKGGGNINVESLFKESLELGKTNIIIIILESFSQEYLNGYTPFLSSLADKSIVFEGYANGKRSIDGIPAVLSSLPLLMDESYITSQYGSNNLSSFASLLKPYGYHSSFFHGGYNGSMGFDGYTKNVGYEEYYGRREYNNDKDYDGNWGIFDEPFLQFMVKKLDIYKEPFTSAVFTLSSHHPYTIPTEHKNKFPKGTMIVHETVGYSDYALRRFFEEAEKKEWFKNTLFIITADHSAITQEAEFKTLLGLFRIPIIFYHPSLRHGIRINKPMQQADILPTAMSLLHYPKPFIAFGQDVLRNKTGIYTLFLNGEYILREGDYLCKYQDGIAPKLFYLPNDSNAKRDIGGDNKGLLSLYVKRIQAIIQEYNSRLVENRMSFDKTNLANEKR